MDRNMSVIANMGCIWLVYKRDGIRKAVSSIHYGRGVSVDIHIHVPKKYRGKGTKTIGMELLNWVKDNSKQQIQKITTKVPVIYKDVIIFARKLGFKDEGIDRKSLMKNGQLVDRQNLGIMMEEIS